MADSSKTEKATPKKRQDEQKKGNIFQSRDVVSAFSILIIFFVLKLALPYIYRGMAQLIARYDAYVKTQGALSVTFANDVLRDVVFAVLLLAGPVMLSSMAASVVATGVQTRFRFSKEKLKFKFSQLNPIQGFKRMISLRSLTELVKTLLKIIVIGAVLYQSFLKIFDRLIELMFGEVMQGVLFILGAIMDMVMQLSLVFLAIAAADYFYQWWEYERDMRMTKQEIKEEFRQQEGDPLVKSQIKERQRKFSMRRMMQQVPTADVIVRNPTHFAVALKYDVEKNRAPVVVAKGQDYLALRIIEIASRNKIPMTENRPLARALYETVDVNHEIPEQYYTVMAEILAWVYSMKKETEGS